eukprot:15439845-Alexandrium_andersonii.AAC.1
MTSTRRRARPATGAGQFLQRTAVGRAPIVVTMAADWPWQGNEFTPSIDKPTMRRHSSGVCMHAHSRPVGHRPGRRQQKRHEASRDTNCNDRPPCDHHATSALRPH